MKRYRIITLVLAFMLSLSLLASCSSTTPSATNAPQNNATATPRPTAEPTTPASSELEELGLDENLRFTETRKIAVEVYDRAVEDGPAPDTGMYAQFIKDGMLRDHNVEVEFVRVPRWTEPDDIANLLAADSAPDICYTYQMPVVETYGKMGGIIDLYPYLDKYENMLPNLFGFLGTELIFWNKDPVDSHTWAIEAKRVDTWQQNLFIREDWLAKLGLSAPKSVQELEDILVQFKDNAATLLGDDASRMIPYLHSYDVSFQWQVILDSLLPDNFSDKDRYTVEFDDRKFLWPAAKETARVLNKWYSMGLSWKDFALYNASTLGGISDDLIRAGYVGAFVGNADYAYRDLSGGSILSVLKESTGNPDAAFISVTPFANDAGKIVRWAPAVASDRKIFFPSTNDEPIASLLYLDWITNLENRMYLQIGDEGKTHVIEPDGAIRIIPATGEYKMNSVNNIDHTITINGLDFGDPELKAKSQALGYAGVDTRYIQKFISDYLDYARPAKSVNVGAIDAEAGIMPMLNDKRDALLAQAITTSPDTFDSVWDAGIADFLASGGQAIKDERTAKWQQYFGDKENLG